MSLYPNIHPPFHTEVYRSPPASTGAELHKLPICSLNHRAEITLSNFSILLEPQLGQTADRGRNESKAQTVGRILGIEFIQRHFGSPGHLIRRTFLFTF